jgi:hypothetical protein
MNVSNRTRAIVAAAAIAGAAIAVSAAPAGAGAPNTLGLSPNPVPAGETVTVTAGRICNVEGLPEGYTFIALHVGDTIVDGTFPGGTSTGTLTVPADTPPGDYRVEAQCTTSLGNSSYYPDTQLTVVAAVVTPTAPATTSTASVADAVATAPAFTG